MRHGQRPQLVGYDPSTKAFTSSVYSSMGGIPKPYGWDVQGDVLTHWDEASKYTGAFSEDGNTIVGGWRPKEGTEADPKNFSYDVTMSKVKAEKAP